MEDQPEIERKFAAPFEACEALEQFGRHHRPTRQAGETLVLSWTLLRSARTFKTVVKLCRLGFGPQASMLNRTLFEDMVFAHWAARFPRRSTRLTQWHEEYVKLRRIAVYERHNVPHHMTRPTWDPTRTRRMKRLFRRNTWTGRSIPVMVKEVETMWPAGAERERLHRMHDVFHQSFNILMHHSARSLSFGVEVDDLGNTSFHVGPIEDLVPLALGFAFWTYANTMSLTVKDDAAVALNELAAKYDEVVPDRALLRLIAGVASEPEGADA